MFIVKDWALACKSIKQWHESQKVLPGKRKIGVVYKKEKSIANSSTIMVFHFEGFLFFSFFCNTIEYGWKCCTMPFFLRVTLNSFIYLPIFAVLKDFCWAVIQKMPRWLWTILQNLKVVCCALNLHSNRLISSLCAVLFLTPCITKVLYTFKWDSKVFVCVKVCVLSWRLVWNEIQSCF